MAVNKFITETEKPLPKQPLAGSVQMEWKKCGRSWCRCAQGGSLHGPYFYRRWLEGGRQKKAYVKLMDLCQTLQAIEMRKRELAPLSGIKASLRRVMC